MARRRDPRHHVIQLARFELGPGGRTAVAQEKLCLSENHSSCFLRGTEAAIALVISEQPTSGVRPIWCSQPESVCKRVACVGQCSEAAQALTSKSTSLDTYHEILDNKAADLLQHVFVIVKNI